MGHWEGRAGQDVRHGIRQQFGHLGKGLPEFFHHSIQLAVDLGGRQLLVDGAHHARKVLGGHARLGALGHSGKQVGHEVGAAALPAGSSKHRGDGVLQPLVGIGEVTSSTPLSPRAVNDRRKASQKAPSSLAPTSIPRIPRRPSALTPVATTTQTFTMRPPSRTFWVRPSSHT